MPRLFKLISYVSAFVLCISCLQEERSPEDVLIPSPAQVDCAEASLVLASKVPAGSEKLVHECGFFVSADKSFSNVIKVEGALNANQFTAEFPVRDYGTTYYMCAYVTNGHGSEIRSDLRSYELGTLDSYIEFGELRLLSHDLATKQTSITVGADIWDGVVVSETGVCYGTEPSSLNIDGARETGSYDKEDGLIAVVLKDMTEATQYYLRPYVKDGEYLSYGEVVPFYIPAVAKVSTFDAEAITASGATLSGEVTDECGSAVTERGFVWIEGDAVPTIEDSHMASGSGLGAMTATVEGLDPNKKYTFRAYATNASGTAYGEAKVFTTLVALPSLATSTISNITSTSATFNGVLANNGGESVSEVGFYYSTEKEVNPETAEKVSLEYSTYQKSAKELSANTLYSAIQSAQAAASDEGESFSIDVYSLGIKTKYYVKSYAVNSAGVAYGSVVNFETAGEIATIKTVGSSEVTTSSAVLAANITTDNGEKITERGFVWMEGTGNPTTDSNKLKVSGEVGEYTATLEGLDPNKKYSFRAYAINAEGTAYGDVMSFTTKVALPALSSVVISSITSTSATISSKVANHGGETVVEVGFYYSTDESLNLETATKVSLPYSADSFSADIADLLVNTKYYVKSFAKNSAGIEYSELETFTTSISFPSVKTVGSSDITSTSAFLSGIVVSDNGASITERGFVWLQGTGTPTTDSFKLKVDGEVGEYSTTLEGLDSNQKYSFRAYAINSKGTAYGEIMTFSTVVDIPTLSSMKVSSITTTSATFTCTVTSHGGETVSEVGFYFGKDEELDMEAAQKVSEEYSSDSFSLTAKDLEIGQNYYVKAYTKNSVGEAYSAVITFKTASTEPSVSTVGYTKLSATSAELSGQVLDDNGEVITERGFVWARDYETPTTSHNKIQIEGELGEYKGELLDIEPNQVYSYRAYATNSVGTAYGDVMQLQIDVTLPTVTTNDVTSITNSSATSGGVITSDGGGEILAKGVVWSMRQNPTLESSNMTNEGEGSGAFTSHLSGLTPGMPYYVRAYATNIMGTVYGEEKQFTTTGEIQGTPLEASNSFIISYPGTYTFQTVKGNSSESVGSVASAEVLWESFGTDEQPEIGSLVPFAVYKNGKITFGTPDQYREGNAVIAAKDASGTILWSWHIWLTDEPEGQVYYNNAGTMMDRNLGATSATPGDVGALGLLYQWGRKDPFLGSSSISSSTVAKSTLTWPSAVSSNSSNGTISYATEHPTIFIKYNSNNYDWYYTGSSSTDNTRWQSDKTIYDPCPVGWRVPDGGDNGVWNVAGFSDTTCDDTNKGMSFSIISPSTTWYPASSFRYYYDGTLDGVGSSGYYWSVSPNSYYAYYLHFNSTGFIHPTDYYYRASGFSVRCQKEGTGGGPQYDNDFSTSGARSLSDAGTANSYIVSSAGTYSISAVKGNSSESVGSVASAEVLWETFGTDEKISKGGLLSGARYENGKIYFKTADSYREGNAVIAAKDASGTILWSWHIWLTDQPQEQIYYNNAGTMMDRNLGATSATPGDVGALGLLYQWGRKDPFLASSSIDSGSEKARSTINWPSTVSSDSSNGTIAYATEHPTIFITYNGNNKDWYYTGSSSTDNTRWQSKKTIYDPCPIGWRVPDGGEDGVWSTAKGSSSEYSKGYDDANKGMNFSGDFGNDAVIWYPAVGGLYDSDGSLNYVGRSSSYGSCSYYPLNGCYSYRLSLSNNNNVLLASIINHAEGRSIRCLKEGTRGPQYDNDFSTSGARSLSDAGTANSYIVSSAGTYSIPAVKGNSSESVGSIASAEVLWETFGTDEEVNIGRLVSGAKYENNRIYFKTADSYREGNAVIAAKDASGTILWSWHIWLTDQPQEHIYNNNAGTMMDRNLGATSATPGDVGALGLLYQWGRKDPFLGSSSIHNNRMEVAESTITWPSEVKSEASTGTIEYAVEHPTTLISSNVTNLDWYYTGAAATDDTRWQSEKTIYDPCPTGWRVPDGGENGVWSVAGFSNTTFDSTNMGVSLSIASPSTTWYPVSGYREETYGSLTNVGYFGDYWSVTPSDNRGYGFYIDYFGYINTKSIGNRSSSYSVRCLKEGTGGGPQYDNDFSTSGARSLSDSGTANSYIVSKSGTYSIPAVKGNSSQSVGSVASAEVLWETFGTDEEIAKGSLLSGAKYENGKIYFKTSDSYREGNAVVAAKDASGTILWSWHIWLTDQPQGQVYNNNAGTMMDRNLGATSATPGDVGALGLLYQWGRKDPFLGSSSLYSNEESASTLAWPSAVSSDSSNGTIAYAVEHPTTFIAYNDYNFDWYYTGSNSTDNTRWTESDKAKSIYDPCPLGWRVPDGGENGVWSKAKGLSSSYSKSYDSTNAGMNFSGDFGNDATIWYPASGYARYTDGALWVVGYYGYYWSAKSTYGLNFYDNNEVRPSGRNDQANALSVRCQKE